MLFTKRALLALLLLAALTFTVGCGQAPAAESPAPAEMTSAPAPEVADEPEEAAEPADKPAGTSGEYDGITFSSSDLTGRKISETYIRDNKVTVVNFWATWCPPCVGEIPDFSEVAAAYESKGCAFLGVQLDEDVDAAKALWEKTGVTYPTILPAGDLTTLSNSMQYVPVTMLFGSDGKQIGEMQIGAVEKDALTALIDAALAGA